jgi:hypothetical protein
MIEVLDPAADWLRIESLLDSATGISLVNAWEAALPELASLDLPHLSPGSADAKASLDEYFRTVWTEANIEAASRYVFFPWRGTIVRLPDADLFWRLRTARNRYLIDEGEQREWSAALIGIAGLSVGASVLAASSLTGARRFRLAERDTLGPTNLNRLAGSVCDFGEPKLTLAMRRTLEADPYSDLEAFPAGYAPEVADAFIGTGDTERLTVLVEEMDDLALKVDIRFKARAAHVPVVMVTDNGDNAILDVERFDLDSCRRQRSHSASTGRQRDRREPDHAPDTLLPHSGWADPPILAAARHRSYRRRRAWSTGSPIHRLRGPAAVGAVPGRS